MGGFLQPSAREASVPQAIRQPGRSYRNIRNGYASDTVV